MVNPAVASIRVVLYAALALLAFAGNSVLCRLALADKSMDPNSFTAIRLISGAGLLLLMVYLRSPSSEKDRSDDTGSWLAAVMLFAYAFLFSWAYQMVDTGTGALILFGAVQITMFAVSAWQTGSVSLRQLLGGLLAILGLMYLVYPQLQTPSADALLLMMLAGVAWAVYTLQGQGSRDALSATAFNFVRCVPIAVLLTVFAWQEIELSTDGVVFAIMSGAITSGLGYAIWYAVLPSLRTVTAAVLQLLVPLIAALGGVLFSSEQFTGRLGLAFCLVLGGIVLVSFSKSQTTND